MGFQVASLLAGEVLVKCGLLDMCEATGYRAVMVTVVSCLEVCTETVDV